MRPSFCVFPCLALLAAMPVSAQEAGPATPPPSAQGPAGAASPSTAPETTAAPPAPAGGVSAPATPTAPVLAPGVSPEPQRVIERVVVVGGSSIPADVAAGAARGVVGKTSDVATIRQAAEAVAGEYRRRGFPVAQTVATDVLPDGTLRLTIAEGVVRSVLVRGNTKTRESTIRTVMQTRPGDVYRADRIAADRDRLARLGIFEDVVIVPDLAELAQNEDTVGLVNVVVRIKERRTGNLAAALGYGDGSGVLGFIDLSETNLGGRAQRITVQAQRVSLNRLNDRRRTSDETRSAYNLSFFAPFIGRERTAFGVDLYDQNTIFQPLFAGDERILRNYERRRGATVRVGRSLSRQLSLFVSGRRDKVGYDTLPLGIELPRPAPSLQDLVQADSTVGALGVELVADARDAAQNPSRGYLYSLAYENASSLLGGNRSFGQFVLDARQYVALTSRKNTPVFAFRVLVGTSTGTVPLPEQFFIGGYELLRGYDLYSIRGDRLLLTSAEARLPLSQGVQGVVFADLGNAWTSGDSADLRAGGGLGLRFLTPIGPIRLDAAYGDGLKTYASLGQAF